MWYSFTRGAIGNEYSLCYAITSQVFGSKIQNIELDCMNLKYQVINSSLGLELESKMRIRTNSGEFQQRNFQIKLNFDLIELVVS